MIKWITGQDIRYQALDVKNFHQETKRFINDVVKSLFWL